MKKSTKKQRQPYKTLCQKYFEKEQNDFYKANPQAKLLLTIFFAALVLWFLVYLNVTI